MKKATLHSHRLLSELFSCLQPEGGKKTTTKNGILQKTFLMAGFENAFMAKEVSVNRAALYLLRQAIQ